MTKKTKLLRRDFPTLEAMAHHIQATPHIDGAATHSHDPAGSWTANMSMNEALDICTTQGGYWAEGAKAIHDIDLAKPERKTFGQANSRRPKRNYAGSRPHVPAAIANATKAMLQPTRQPRFKPSLKMGVMVMGPAASDTDYFYNRGAAVLSAVRALEKQGTQVELIGIMYANGQKHNWINTMTIKHAGDKLSPADLSYILTHCTVTRRLYMGLVERDPDFYKESLGGYGNAGPLDEKTTAELGLDLIIPMPSPAYNTPANADKTVSNLIDEHFASKQDNAA